MKKIIPIAIALIMALAMTEIVLRIFLPTPWVNGYSPSYYTGTKLTPNSNGVWNQEGQSIVSVNQEGFNDDNHVLAKAKNIIRIAVIGDSYVEALQVQRDKTFWKVLENRLNSECRGPYAKKFEVLAFGVSGWGPSQEYFAALNYAKKYDPDFYIFHITTGNDIRNQSRNLEQDPNRPYLIYSSGKWVWDLSFKNENYQNSFVQSSAFSSFETYKWSKAFLRIVKNKIMSTQKSSKTSQTGKTTQKNIELGLDNHIYLPQYKLDKEWQFAWESTLQTYNKMIELVGKKKILFEIGSNGAQVFPNKSVRSSFANSISVRNLLEPNERISKFLNSKNVQYIDSVEVLLSKRNSITGYHGKSPDWGGHWNSAGHKEVGQALATKVCEQF